MKKPTTFEEQLSLMKSRGLVIGDEDKCLAFLRSNNYYRLSAYLLPFKQKDDLYISGTTFEKIYQIYEFDRKLRLLLLSVIEEIELHLRTQLSYYFAHKYGALGYLDEMLYGSSHNHTEFIEKVNVSIDNNKNTPIVKHHKAEYNGNLPIWAIIDFFSIGNLSYFYRGWTSQDRKNISEKLLGTRILFLDSWFKCLTVLRNHCAHYSRLYYVSFKNVPKIPESVDYSCSNCIFDQLLMLRFMYPHKHRWHIDFLLPLEALIGQYQNSINFLHIGFLEDWQEILAREYSL